MLRPEDPLMPPNQMQGPLGKVKRSMPSPSATSAANWVIISKIDCVLPPTESRLPWQADWGEGEPRPEGAASPPSDRERREGAAGVAQSENPGNAGPPPLPRLPGPSAALCCGPAFRLAAAYRGPACALTPRAPRGGAERGRLQTVRNFPLNRRPRPVGAGQEVLLPRRPRPGSSGDQGAIRNLPGTHGPDEGQYVGSMLIALT